MNERRDEREEQIQIIKCITENAQLAGEWTYADDTRFVGCQFPQGGKNSVCEVQPALGRSTAALGQFLAMTRTGVPLLLAELADLRQQLAEARAERDGFQCQLKAFDKLHWELVDLFDKNAGGVSPLHYVKERIAAQAAELATLRERLAAAEKENDAIITQALADAGIDMEPGYARLREMIAEAKKRSKSP